MFFSFLPVPRLHFQPLPTAHDWGTQEKSLERKGSTGRVIRTRSVMPLLRSKTADDEPSRSRLPPSERTHHRESSRPSPSASVLLRPTPHAPSSRRLIHSGSIRKNRIEGKRQHPFIRNQVQERHTVQEDPSGQPVTTIRWQLLHRCGRPLFSQEGSPDFAVALRVSVKLLPDRSIAALSA